MSAAASTCRRGWPAWQMPQGGIDPGETPREAALRELKEEVGTDKAEILAETAGWLHYDLPPEIAGTHVGRALSRPAAEMVRDALYRRGWRHRPRRTEHPEFDAWEWVAAERLPELIVPFKRQLYLAVLAELRRYCGRKASRTVPPEIAPAATRLRRRRPAALPVLRCRRGTGEGASCWMRTGSGNWSISAGATSRPDPGRVHPHPEQIAGLRSGMGRARLYGRGGQLFEGWARERLAALPGATLEVVRLPGRTPLILIEMPGERRQATRCCSTAISTSSRR